MMATEDTGALLTPLATASLLREEADSRLEAQLRVLPRQGEEVSCRAGCAYCCRQLVLVSPLEALALAEYLSARPALAAAVRARVEAWETALEGSPELARALDRLLAGELPDAEGAALEDAYWEARLVCPFLEENLCSVYPVRPFSCREHLVTSDPALCDTSLDAPSHAGTRLEFRMVSDMVGAACHGLDETLILLPRALEWAERMPVEGHPAPEAQVRRTTETLARRIRLALERLMGWPAESTPR